MPTFCSSKPRIANTLLPTHCTHCSPQSKVLQSKPDQLDKTHADRPLQRSEKGRNNTKKAGLIELSRLRHFSEHFRCRNDRGCLGVHTSIYHRSGGIYVAEREFYPPFFPVLLFELFFLTAQRFEQKTHLLLANTRQRSNS